MAIDPADSATLYATEGQSVAFANRDIHVTHDGGATWTTADFNKMLPYVTDITFNPTVPHEVWVGTSSGIWASDGGSFWVYEHFPPLTGSGSAMATVVFDPAANGIIYAGTNRGAIWASRDSGATWADISGSSLLDWVTTLAVNPAHPANVLAGGFAGLLGSADSGSTWTEQMSGIEASRVFFFSVDASSNRVYMNAEADGIHYLTGGASATLPVNNLELSQLNSTPHQVGTEAILAQPNQRVLVALSTEVARYGRRRELVADKPASPAYPLPGQHSGQHIREFSRGPGSDSRVVRPGNLPLDGRRGLLHC